MNENFFKMLQKYNIPIFILSDMDEEDEDKNELELALRERFRKPNQKADRWMPSAT